MTTATTRMPRTKKLLFTLELRNYLSRFVRYAKRPKTLLRLMRSIPEEKYEELAVLTFFKIYRTWSFHVVRDLKAPFLRRISAVLNSIQRIKIPHIFDVGIDCRISTLRSTGIVALSD